MRIMQTGSTYPRAPGNPAPGRKASLQLEMSTATRLDENVVLERYRQLICTMVYDAVIALLVDSTTAMTQRNTG
jgi:hypothetical protein